MKERMLNFKESILYVCRLQFGDIKKLINVAGEHNVNTMKNAGYISCGKNPTQTELQDTWKVTQAAKEYCKVAYGRIFF